MKLTDEALWEQFKSDDDPYTRVIIRFAARWAGLMEVKIAQGQAVADCADAAEAELHEDLTGFMYNAAVAILAGIWEHGEELRKWHNKRCGYDGEGVANPTILKI